MKAIANIKLFIMFALHCLHKEMNAPRIGSTIVCILDYLKDGYSDGEVTETLLERYIKRPLLSPLLITDDNLYCNSTFKKTLLSYRAYCFIEEQIVHTIRAQLIAILDQQD